MLSFPVLFQRPCPLSAVSIERQMTKSWIVTLSFGLQYMGNVLGGRNETQGNTYSVCYPCLD